MNSQEKATYKAAQRKNRREAIAAAVIGTAFQEAFSDDMTVSSAAKIAAVWALEIADALIHEIDTQGAVK